MNTDPNDPEQQRKLWLQNLKAGAEVIVVALSGNNGFQTPEWAFPGKGPDQPQCVSTLRTDRVVKVTPKGTIVISNGIRFAKDGDQMIPTGLFGINRSESTLVEPTTELLRLVPEFMEWAHRRREEEAREEDRKKALEHARKMGSVSHLDHPTNGNHHIAVAAYDRPASYRVMVEFRVNEPREEILAILDQLRDSVSRYDELAAAKAKEDAETDAGEMAAESAPEGDGKIIPFSPKS